MSTRVFIHLEIGPGIEHSRAMIVFYSVLNVGRLSDRPTNCDLRMQGRDDKPAQRN